MDRKYSVPSVDASVDILTFLSEHADDGVGFGVTEIARQLNLKKSTCFNILHTLVARSWLTFMPRTRTYRLGPGVMQLGSTAHREHQVLRIFRAIAEFHSADTGWATILTQLNPYGEIVAVDKIESRQPIKVTVTLGQRFPISAASLGRTYLAFLPPEESARIWPSDPLPRFTPHSVTTQSELVNAVQETRQRGFSTSCGEYYEVQNAVSAPIFDPDGHVSYAICTLAFSSALTREMLPFYGARILSLARDITVASGGRWPLALSESTHALVR